MYLLLGGRGSPLAMLKVYSRRCTQVLLLEVLWKLPGMPGIEPRLAVCKARTLTAVLSEYSTCCYTADI